MGGFTGISLAPGRLTMAGITASKMVDIMRAVHKDVQHGKGGFTDLDTVLGTHGIGHDAARLLFMAVLQAWLAGNVSNVGRTDFPARSQVMPDPPYTTYTTMMKRAVQLASPRLFDDSPSTKRAAAALDEPLLVETPLRTPKKNANKDSTMQDLEVNDPTTPAQRALEIRCLTQVLENDKRGARLMGIQVLRLIATSIRQVKRYSQLKNFCNSVEDHLDLFERYTDPLNPLAPPRMDCVRVGDLQNQIAILKEESDGGNLNALELMVALEDIPVLKPLGQALTKRIKAEQANKKAMRQIISDSKKKDDDGDDLDLKTSDGVDRRIDKKMSSHFSALNKSILNLGKNFQKQRGGQQDDSSRGTKRQKRDGDANKGKGKGKDGVDQRGGFSKLRKVLQDKFPDAHRGKISAKLFDALSSRCLYCLGPTVKRDSGRGVVCKTQCTRAEPSPQIISTLKALTSIE